MSLKTKYWEDKEKELNLFFESKDYSRLIQNPVIQGDMCVDKCGWLQTELSHILSKGVDMSLLKEHGFGAPTISCPEYQTGGNMIHHMYHLLRYEEETKKKISDFKHIVEWGGGYGNMCKLVRRLNPNCTYTIVDLEIMSKLQNIYLSNVLEEEISVGEVKSGKVNLITVDSFDEFDYNNDLFISTWGLSESGPEALNQVIEKNMFTNILIAYQDYWKEKFTEIDKMIEHLGEFARIKIDHIPDNYYAFR